MLDPNLIDTITFTREQQQCSGEVRLQALNRRVWSHELLVKRDAVIQFQARGGTDRWQRPFINVSVKGELQLICQRCLQAVSWTLSDQSHVVLFADEQSLDEAMVADEALEGILWQEQFNLVSLIEDQILMAIPVAPRHSDCDHVLATSTNQASDNPFAKLVGLKSGR
ncbi:MAG: DUF177 domain-containing protein [Snodgrassella sp.]|nr:DUF177 domain-containing protein [Snodgrassella sp.]